MTEQPIAVYVHIPFCPSKCGYCDFNSYAMSGDIFERTTRAMIAEIERSPLRSRPAKTIFFGGGTPTFIETDQMVRILDAVIRVHPPLEDTEITSEANPGTVDATKFKSMRTAGFNRISLGAQSFLDTDLHTLGRVHGSADIERAVAAARDAGFDNLNLDLMFALPRQSTFAWKRNLALALALKPEHLSLYCLTIEPNTPFYKQNLHGQLDLPDDDSQVLMYEECLHATKLAGLRQYEISNFALPGRECRHNLCYWHGEEYAGYGPGAVGCTQVGDKRVRATNLKHPERYCASVEAREKTAFEEETLSDEALRTERIMLGLRLNDGLLMKDLRLAASVVQAMRARRWVEVEDQKLKLTDLGRNFCSEAVLELI